MPASEQDQLKAITTFFEARPEREYFVGEVGLDVIRAASAAGWIYAIASQPTPKTLQVGFLLAQEGQKAFLVVVRRADPAGGYSAPCMVIMDGGFPPPPFDAIPERALHDRAMESFGDEIWQLAVETRKTGATVYDAFAALMFRSILKGQPIKRWPRRQPTPSNASAPSHRRGRG